MLYNEKLLNDAISDRNIHEARFGAITPFISSFPGNPGQWLQHARQKAEEAFGDRFYDEYDDVMSGPDSNRENWNRDSWLLAQGQLTRNFSKVRFVHLIDMSDYLREKSEHPDFLRVPDMDAEQNAITRNSAIGSKSENITFEKPLLTKIQMIGIVAGGALGLAGGVPWVIAGAGTGFVIVTIISAGSSR